MVYVGTFLEGIISFLSPCILPLIPVYMIYFTGTNQKLSEKSIKLLNVAIFILGFTLVFAVLGGVVSLVSQALNKYRIVVNIVTGAIIVFFGLRFLGLFGSKGNTVGLFQNKTHRKNQMTLWGTLLFGATFAVTWTPCAGPYLGKALGIATQSRTVVEGVLLLVAYSLGLGVPFFLSALFLDELQGAFSFFKRHQDIITKISGILMILMGLLIATGVMGHLFLLLS